MKTELRFRALEPSAALREHAVRRVHFQLSRFGEEITTVQIRLADINGPKGGLDKCCQVSVRGPRLGSTTVDERSEDAQSAVDGAIERVNRAVSRALQRTRGRRDWGGSSLRRPSTARGLFGDGDGRTGL